MTPAAMTAIHAAPLPATLTVAAIDGLQPFGGGSLPMTARETAIRSDESPATFYGPDGRAVCTMTRPRMYSDAETAEPGTAGLFRVRLTDGRLVAVSVRPLTLGGLRAALLAYLRPVHLGDVDGASDAQCEAEIASAEESVTQNLAAAGSATMDHSRASALTRAARAARLRAIWAAALSDGCAKCDGAGEVSRAPGLKAPCPNCQPALIAALQHRPEGKHTMFARFYAARAAKAAEAPAYVCRDRFTGLEIARGSLAQMQAFQTAFGQCEIARA